MPEPFPSTDHRFTIVVGRHKGSLTQYSEEEHRHLPHKIPGIQTMMDKFK